MFNVTMDSCAIVTYHEVIYVMVSNLNVKMCVYIYIYIYTETESLHDLHIVCIYVMYVLDCFMHFLFLLLFACCLYWPKQQGKTTASSFLFFLQNWYCG